MPLLASLFLPLFLFFPSLLLFSSSSIIFCSSSLLTHPLLFFSFSYRKEKFPKKTRKTQKKKSLSTNDLFPTFIRLYLIHVLSQSFYYYSLLLSFRVVLHSVVSLYIHISQCSLSLACFVHLLRLLCVRFLWSVVVLSFLWLRLWLVWSPGGLEPRLLRLRCGLLFGCLCCFASFAALAVSISGFLLGLASLSCVGIVDCAHFTSRVASYSPPL